MVGLGDDRGFLSTLRFCYSLICLPDNRLDELPLLTPARSSLSSRAAQQSPPTKHLWCGRNQLTASGKPWWQRELAIHQCSLLLSGIEIPHPDFHWIEGLPIIDDSSWLHLQWGVALWLSSDSCQVSQKCCVWLLGFTLNWKGCVPHFLFSLPSVWGRVTIANLDRDRSCVLCITELIYLSCIAYLRTGA